MSDIIEVTKQLDEKFKDYLLEQGIRIGNDSFFRCINPNHPDHNPSMSIGGSADYKGKIAHCFSCNASYNIFHAVHFLEGKPITGVGFYEETLPYLCKKYNIPYEPSRISNEQRDIFQKRAAVRDAVSIVNSMIFKGVNLNKEHPAVEHLLERGITDKTIKKYKLGCITTFKEYIEEMKKLGYKDRDWLNRVDLANKSVFNKDNIIIPVHDERGRPVGFVSRKTSLKPNDKGKAKYSNSINSDIYNKGKILFNYNNYDKTDGPLWIVEGYLDAIYLDQCGITNVAAIGATALTENHVDMLARDNIRNIYLALDGDEGGRKGIELAIERMGAYQVFKNTRIIDIPEGMDPDQYVRTNGVKKFEELSDPDVALSPFIWTLKHASFEDDPMVIAERAIPTIASEESNIKRLRMIKELSRITGLSQHDIRKDVDILVNKDSSVFIDEVSNINKYVQVALSRRKIQDTKSILEESLMKIRNIEGKFNNSIDSRNTFNDRRQAFREKIENNKYSYGLLSPKFAKLEKMLDGIPFTTNLSLIGGRPSSGKTALMTALALDVVRNNDDCAVLYMSIDDTTELMTLKILASYCGLSTSEIKAYINLSKENKRKVNEAWEWIDKVSERFIISDAVEGTTIETMETRLEWFNKQFPDTKKIMFLDNFHKLNMRGARDRNSAISDMSERIKELTKLYDINIFSTVELRKLADSAQRPSPNDLFGASKLEYDADIGILVHNDKQVNQESNIVWMGQYGEDGMVAMPYVELQLFKNKVTGITGQCAYKLSTYNLRVQEDSYATIQALRKKNAGSQKIKGGSIY